jgi:pyridoxamine 5'-phosphate oxidase
VDERDLDPDPIGQFDRWLAEARATCPQPYAMTLATVGPDGRPSARVVLLRDHDHHGLVFFTNRESRKGEELRAHPHAALVFHWWELGRQVRTEGTVEQLDALESDAYWRTRPRESRLAAWASPQSQVIRDRDELDRRYTETTARFGEEDVPLPPFWGGFRVIPDRFEFWTHRENRLHDRVRYVRSAGAWRRERLAP